MLDAEHLAGAREAGLHLIRNEQDAMGVANLAQFDEQLLRRFVKAALALDRFEHDRRNAFRVDGCLETGRRSP